MLSKMIELVKRYQHSIFLGFCILLIALISFNLGRINATKKTALKIDSNGLAQTNNSDLQANVYKTTSKPLNSPAKSSATTTPRPTPKPLQVVVSKASTTKKYHFSYCPGAKQIKAENQIWFNTEADAIAAGYSLAGNCTR